MLRGYTYPKVLGARIFLCTRRPVGEKIFTSKYLPDNAMASFVKEAAEERVDELGRKRASLVVRHAEEDWTTADADAIAGLEEAVYMVTSGAADLVSVFIFGCMCWCGWDRVRGRGDDSAAAVCVFYKGHYFQTPREFIDAWNRGLQDVVAQEHEQELLEQLL